MREFIKFFIPLLFPFLLAGNPREIYKRAHEYYFYAQEYPEKENLYLDKAFKEYHYLLKKYPRSPYISEALFHLGMIYRQRKDYSRMFEAWLLLNFLYPSSEEVKKTAFFIINKSPSPRELPLSQVILDEGDDLYILEGNRLHRYNRWAEFKDTLSLSLPRGFGWMKDLAVLKDFIVVMGFKTLYIFDRKGNYLGEFDYPDESSRVSFQHIWGRENHLVLEYSRRESIKKKERIQSRRFRMHIEFPQGEIIREEEEGKRNSRFNKFEEWMGRDLREKMFFLVSRKDWVIRDRWRMVWGTFPKSLRYFPSLPPFPSEIEIIPSYLCLNSGGIILGYKIKNVYSLFPPPPILYYFYGERWFYSSLLNRKLYLRIPDSGWREYIRSLKELERGNTGKGLRRLERLISSERGKDFLFPVALIFIEIGEEKKGEKILYRLSQDEGSLARNAIEYLANFYEERGELRKSFSLRNKLKELYRDNPRSYYPLIASLWTFQERHRYFPYLKEELSSSGVTLPPFYLEKKKRILNRPLSFFDVIALSRNKIYMARKEGKVEIFNLEGEKTGEFSTRIIPYYLSVEGEILALRGRDEKGKEVLKIFREGELLKEIPLNIREDKLPPPYWVRNQITFIQGKRIYYLLYNRYLKFFDLVSKENGVIIFPYYWSIQHLIMEQRGEKFYLFSRNGLRKVDRDMNLIFFSPWEGEGTRNGVMVGEGRIILSFFPQGKVEFFSSTTGKKLGERELPGLKFLLWNIPLARDKSGDIYLLDKTGVLWKLRPG